MSLAGKQAIDAQAAADLDARRTKKTTAKEAEAKKAKGPQLTPADLASMTAEEIVQAYDSGNLNTALGWAPADVAVVDRARAGDQLTRQDIEVLRRLEQHQLIIQAVDQGRISDDDDETAGARESDQEGEGGERAPGRAENALVTLALNEGRPRDYYLKNSTISRNNQEDN